MHCFSDVDNIFFLKEETDIKGWPCDHPIKQMELCYVRGGCISSDKAATPLCQCF
jgi:hypothetical protein